VNSFLREARSLFTPRYIEKLSAVILPDPLPFRNIKLERRLSTRYQSSFDAVALVKDACTELGAAEPEQFKIILLALQRLPPSSSVYPRAAPCPRPCTVSKV
jgi:hypothetical protein